MPDEGDGYRLETGISLREYDMCDEKFKTKLATSLAGYKKVSTSIQFTAKFLYLIRYDLNNSTLTYLIGQGENDMFYYEKG